MIALWAASLAIGAAAPASFQVEVTPAGVGKQLVRTSLPLPAGLLRRGEILRVSDGKRTFDAGTRILTYYPGEENPSARRAIATFPYTFRTAQPVSFTVQAKTATAQRKPDLPVQIALSGETLTLTYREGATLRLEMLAPPRQSNEPPRTETIEENAYYRWQRTIYPDPQWARIVEVRADALGGVTIIGHLQRNLPGDAYAPEFGWRVLSAGGAALRFERPAANLAHSFKTGESCAVLVGEKLRLTHPTAPFKRKGDAQLDASGTRYAYRACIPEESVPMQEASWRRAEVVLAPIHAAPPTPTLEYAHTIRLEPKRWDALYQTGEPLDLNAAPELKRLLEYHHQAMTRMTAIGDDWGNVTGYSDSSRFGGVYGMNRLNHCLPLFEEGYRSGDRRLIETALLWCENFYDLSIWWGEKERGGTRYNNSLAAGGKAYQDDRRYMWRSNYAVSFCTKGYEAFFVAYEETGDPRMQEALQAQVAYAAKYVQAGLNYTRNVGDVRDLLRLYRWTKESRYLEQSLRLFGDLRACLSTGDLFTESGQPIVPNPPFINDDTVGPKYPYAKPYILGYALAGLPELLRLKPDEPKLQEVVRAVADFMAESQDAIGGWRYPHPRSSYVIVSQGVEHAWQLAQAGRTSPPEESHLDAIERALRQRYWGWKQTGQIFNGLGSWELATGKIKQSGELHALYRLPADRDATRDYGEGELSFGGSSPEGLVYFPELLAYYLQHRKAERLLTPPRPEEPLGKVLARKK